MKIVQIIEEIREYLTRPFKWWFRKDKVSDHLSYAMSVEALPNPQGWITGAVISFFCECDVTKNSTSFERVLNFPEQDIIYTKSALDDEDLKQELSARVQQYINLKREATYAREMINTQVLIEAGVTWGLLLILAVILATAGISINGY